MNVKVIKILISFVICAALLWCGFLVMARGGSSAIDEDRQADSDVSVSAVQSRRERFNKKRQAFRGVKVKPVALGAEHLGKPQMFPNDVLKDEELSDLARLVLEELQNAIDVEDFDAVARIVTQFTSRELKNFKGLSKKEQHLLLDRAVGALSWFGASAIPDLVGCLAAAVELGDQEVVEDIQGKLEQALQDFELSDIDLAKIVVQLASVVTDATALDGYFIELCRMRHSVGISTLIEIAQSGTPEAQSKVPENISFFTGDDTIVTVEDAEKWLENNPDDEDDPYFYGGQERPPSGEMVTVKVDIDAYFKEQERATESKRSQ